LLAVAQKPALAKLLGAAGLGDGGPFTATAVVSQGWFEIALAAAVLACPAWPLLLLVLVWKVGTEMLFPLTGDYVWEFIERGGSFGAPLGLLILSTARARPGWESNPAAWRSGKAQRVCSPRGAPAPETGR
jgi:hypothetical protein